MIFIVFFLKNLQDDEFSFFPVTSDNRSTSTTVDESSSNINLQKEQPLTSALDKKSIFISQPPEYVTHHFFPSQKYTLPLTLPLYFSLPSTESKSENEEDSSTQGDEFFTFSIFLFGLPFFCLVVVSFEE